MAGLEHGVAAEFVAVSDIAKNNYVDEKSGHHVASDDVSSHDFHHELDGIHDGLEFPTDEERATLRRVKDSIPWNAYRA